MYERKAIVKEIQNPLNYNALSLQINEKKLISKLFCNYIKFDFLRNFYKEIMKIFT